MKNRVFEGFIQSLMMEEIAPAIEGEKISLALAHDFARNVLDRFRNPYIEHLWWNITLQYSSKMCLRNVPLIRSYIQRFGKVPQRMALGFAAHLRFMKSTLAVDYNYYGEWLGKKYMIKDDHAKYYAEIWENYMPAQMVDMVLRNENLWKGDLTRQEGFADAVLIHLNRILLAESEEAIQELMRG
jgi:tagaturonate reductase